MTPAGSAFRPRLVFLALLGLLLAAAVPILAEYRIGGFAVGCQAYTFNRLTAFEAIEKTEATSGTVTEDEFNWDHSVPEVAQRVGFIRGWSAANGLK